MAECATLTVSNHETKCFVRQCPYYVPEVMTNALIMSKRQWPMPLLCPRGDDRCPYYVPGITCLYI